MRFPWIALSPELLVEALRLGDVTVTHVDWHMSAVGYPAIRVFFAPGAPFDDDGGEHDATLRVEKFCESCNQPVDVTATFTPAPS